MSIVIEDGTGLSTAESYISVADATTYFTARAVTAWGALATDALREAALRKATEYMDYHYDWRGERVTPTVQALDWPRSGVVVDGNYIESDEIPEAIKRACAELALKASAGDLYPDLERQTRREKVGPIEVEYEPGSFQNTRYAAIDAMLKDYVKGGSSRVNTGLIRC